jgi:hypothetical protein
MTREPSSDVLGCPVRVRSECQDEYKRSAGWDVIVSYLYVRIRSGCQIQDVRFKARM